MPNGLQAGDTVVDLAAMVRSAAILSGLVSAGFSAWISKRHIGSVFVYALIGVVVGVIVGSVVGRVLFPAAAGQAQVVKAGPLALTLTLRGGIVGGIASAVLASLIVCLGTHTRLHPGVWLSIGIGLVLGGAVGYLSATA